MTRPPDRHEIVRRAHQQAVLSAVLTAGPLSRRDVATITHLSKPVVLALVTELTESGLIRQQGQAGGRVGRSPDLYVANTRAGFIVGIDLGGTKLRAALADLDGAVLCEVVEGTVQGRGTEVADQILALIRHLARNAHVPIGKITAIAVGSPGVVDADGKMQLAVNVSGLSDFSLQDHIRGPFPKSVVVVDNDVNIAAIGERAEGSGVGCDDLIVLSIGTGIGAGVIVNGRLVRGHHGAAGEVAWLPLGTDPTTRESRHRGALEMAAAGDGVQRTLRGALRKHPASMVHPDASVVEIFAAAAAGDPAARAVLVAEAHLVALAVIALASTLDPERVVLAGGIGANPDLLPLVVAELSRLAPFPITVESSKLGERSGVVGALALARSLARRKLFNEGGAADA